ncbi:MAG: cupin domain-containing protein [Rhizobiaceae bacterium]|nr:cupin domain-containing protein [Rhizobiaceae bacterium]
MQDQFQPTMAAAALQVPGNGSQSVNADAFVWSEPTPGFRIKPLFDGGGYRTYLMSIEPGADCAPHAHDDVEHIFVLEGSFSDEDADYRKGDLVVRAAGALHTASSKTGATVLVTYFPA